MQVESHFPPVNQQWGICIWGDDVLALKSQPDKPLPLSCAEVVFHR